MEIKSKLTEVGYELEDVFILQTPISYIRHRSECNPYIEMAGRKVFPVVVAPMGAVTDENNYKIWLDNGFIPVVPRTVDFDKRIEISKETFASFSLSEAETLSKYLTKDTMQYICIDIAHGTMAALYDVCKKLKKKFKDKITIMTGNVANWEAYLYYADAGIDYMRACIGSGSRCTTRCNLGVGCPAATLIDNLRMEKEKWEGENCKDGTKIIVDGGIRNFDDIQKSIALGAECIMGGYIFAQAEEACGQIFFHNPENNDYSDVLTIDEYNRNCEFYKDNDAMYSKLMKYKAYREYYGMSTKKAQKLTGGSGKKTAEGISRPVLVEYPIAKWAENMKDYLISCMSYTGHKTIEELRNDTKLIRNGSSDRSFRK